MTPHFTIVSYKHIFDSGTYDLHLFCKNHPVPHELLESFKNTGIHAPPTLIEQQDGLFDIVCGRRRLKYIFQHTEERSCYCRILPNETSVETILLNLLEDQYQSNTLTIIEQAQFLDLCMKLLQTEDKVKKYLENLPKGRITFGRSFLAPLMKLDSNILVLIHSSIISDKSIKLLRKFSNPDQTAIANLINKLHFGANNQKKLLQYLIDIQLRNHQSLSEILEEETLLEIIDHPEMNNQQKSNRLLYQLDKMCHPMLTEAQKNFDKEIKTIDLLSNCTITATKSFEKDDVSLTIGFKNVEELKSLWPDLQKVLKK